MVYVAAAGLAVVRRLAPERFVELEKKNPEWNPVDLEAEEKDKRAEFVEIDEEECLC